MASMPPQTDFDYIFAGGGLAALSLAWRITHSSSLRERSILIVDRDEKLRDDRTFSFWSDRPGPFDPAVCRAWDRLSFQAPGFERTLELGHYRYQTIRGIDFYRLVREDLSAHSQVAFLHAHIDRLCEIDDRAVISAGGRRYSGRWAFDSRFQPGKLIRQPQKYQYLQMAFRGWEVETTTPVFDPQVATLMDFRTPAQGDMRFFYVLPFDEHHALVEYTLFTPQPSGLSAGDAALECYLQTAFGLHPGPGCQVRAREAGGLLITDHTFPRRLGRCTLAIGLRGGQLKPSTGYAFTRIQRDSEAILLSLENSGHPFDLPPASPLYTELDSIMLEVMRSYPDRIPQIFTALFRNNPVQRVLRFLDEDAPAGEVRSLMASLPPGLFLRILARRGIAPPAFLRSLLLGR